MHLAADWRTEENDVSVVLLDFRAQLSTLLSYTGLSYTPSPGQGAVVWEEGPKFKDKLHS